MHSVDSNISGGHRNKLTLIPSKSLRRYGNRSSASTMLDDATKNRRAQRAHLGVFFVHYGGQLFMGLAA